MNTDQAKLENAFKDLDYEDEAFNDLDKALQRKVSTGMTDGSKPIESLEQEVEMLRARIERLEHTNFVPGSVTSALIRVYRDVNGVIIHSENVGAQL